MIPTVFDPLERPTPRLVHFTGRPRGDSPLPGDVAHLNAEQRLASILVSGQLRAFPVYGTVDVPVIGASDISPADLEAAFRTGLSTRGPFEPWALVLSRTSMWVSGARPVLYADYAEAPKIRAALDERSPGRSALVQRIDLIMYRSDWTHEREWRWIAGAARERIPVWPQLDAVIVAQKGWQPPGLGARPDAAKVQRWWWSGTHLIDDGLITEPSPYE
ncbi:hypothetical protein [Cellulomonas fengjieae]|uniref:Uncharacterized protein n=1 Tax=Cellulomonas fengjieae TaxID=2819978 RepID=A0ABS3SHE1_9CELL|nr:hypothetical protein [Cellulomonas fengjieae]MBO3085171.1 hypothetical protein [Cellulomonas fengjieae]QVI66256.1 hypothetical protein KG102_01105 [Cellulomonas fengjieae]